MSKLQHTCPVCNHRAELDSEYRIGNLISKRYKCGHIQTYIPPKVEDFRDFISLDGKKPYSFQVEGAVFALNSNGRFLIMDEMGLGKTVQALMVAKSLKKRFLVLAKSGLKIQWMREIQRWCGEDYISQIISSEQDFIVPAKAYICSFDLLWRFKDIPEFIKKLKVDYIIMDEVQHIKNTASKRTQGIRAACKEVTYIGALSGTPIKNNGSEFFSVLNILRPDKFPSQTTFDQVFIDSYWSGKVLKHGGLKNPTKFKEYTKDFIIRRTREQVLPDLPKVIRDYRFCQLGEAVEEAYKDTFKQFQQYYNYGGVADTAFQRSSNILAYLTKMRHLTGIAKINPVVDFTEDFIESTDRKLMIFIHHKDVAKKLVELLRERLCGCTNLYGNDILHLPEDVNARPAIVDLFGTPKYRILVASTLASGEGLNLQFCSDCAMMERQWNPANEEQAEARFPRPGQLADRINATYFTAVGTVDEFFAKLVEQKRSISANTLDGKEIKWDESNLIKELAEVLAQLGGKKWGW